MDAYIESVTGSDHQLEDTTFFIEHDKMLLREEIRWIEMAKERLQAFKND